MATLHFWEWGKIFFKVNYAAGLMQGVRHGPRRTFVKIMRELLLFLFEGFRNLLAQVAYLLQLPLKIASVVRLDSLIITTSVTMKIKKVNCEVQG